MAQNPGKKFEEDFFKSFPELVDVSIDRVYDNQSGYRGHTTICDFIVYSYPHQYYFELKSYEGKSIPLSAIRPHQFDGLLNKSSIKGVRAGVILNFRISDQIEFAYFIDIRDILKLKAEDKKSISFSDCSIIGILLEGHLKRTRYRYDVEQFLKDLEVN